MGLPLRFALQIFSEALRLLLRSAVSNGALPTTTGVLPARVVAAVLVVDARHGSAFYSELLRSARAMTVAAPAAARVSSQARIADGSKRSMAPSRMQGRSPRSAAL